jgi:hypothetical protein
MSLHRTLCILHKKTDVARAPAAEHFNLNHLIKGLNPATGTVKEKIAITE